ncbi:MAG: putative secreted cellulase [Actinomycetia bacterium]|nr:putative secreted cellulase [Actinomycetes bacterium]
MTLGRRRGLTAPLAGALAAGAAVTLVAAGSLAVGAATGRAAAATAPGVGAGYWHTSGNQILDSNGNPVRIAGLNWYGFETPDEIAHGLWAQDYHTIINDIAALGYNTIRIPFSNQMVETPIVPQNLAFTNNSGPINTDLKSLTSLQDLQKIVTAAGQAGLKVILDDHRSEAGESAEQDGLWYTSTYTSQDWINDWATLAKMFAGNPTVIGFDLRNEPHTPAGDTYAEGATWGTGNSTTDVRLAYEQAGNAILAADPGALIFCEGISEFPDASASGGYDTTWWGGDLQGVAQYPVVLSSPGHVVYSAHDYGPSLFQQAWFTSAATPASLDAVWNKYWGYIYAQGTAPVWVGEFGTDNTSSDIESSAAGSQGQWFESLVSYIKSNPWMGWTYWALNGEDSYDLLDNNYDPTPVSALKQSLLAGIQFPLPGAGNGTPPPSSPPPSSPPPAQLSCAFSVVNSWSGGFQAQVVISNTGSGATSSWKASWAFPGGQQVASGWSGVFTESGANVTVTNEPYNGSIAPGSSVTIGFTATGTAPSSLTVTC